MFLKQAVNRCSRVAFSTQVNNSKQFVIVLKDYEDEGCLARRMSARNEHLTQAIDNKKKGDLLLGGAIVDSHESSKMKGSILIAVAQSVDEVESRIKQDPYYLGKVWEKWDIYPFKDALSHIQ